MAIYYAIISPHFLVDNHPSSSEFSGTSSSLFFQNSLCLSSSMATRTRSHFGESTSLFTNQNLLKHPEKEVCSFDNADIAALRTSGAFSDKAVIRPLDQSIRSDVSSEEWICFSSYPFSLGLRYPFPEFIMHFFRTTGLCFAQTMPMVWRVLIMRNQIETLHVPDLCIEDIPIAYRLRSHGNNRFLLFSTSSNHLILKVSRNEDGC
ncbi:hypothetical protein HanXRQr2_Chr09g0382961 [Helianthus annuus]|uniref:Uncharacterized protein n=1 Tax=Helianthus annuus TaxID=4232 RepID=A0A9K3N827_HELAN|nr:hypothetical protein HanXRQr2_Chr09g0382961 [Helianthus annuus]KAJ0533829.1 hypothetical protein HanIR_Chr09g0412901 [Helianthus annuus]